MDVVQKVQYLQDVTGMADPEQCAAILEAHNWDLDAAVGTMLAVTSGDREDTAAGSPHGGIGLRSRNGASSSSAGQWVDADVVSVSGEIGDSPETNHGPPGRISSHSQSSVVWKLITLPYWMLRRSINVMTGAVGLGLRAAGGVLSFSFATMGSITTWAAGGAQPYGRLPQPRADSTLFIERFEAEYGVVHPAFVDLTFMEAVRRAGEQFKFLFVYLHSPEHVNTPAFCRATLCSEPVAQFVNENFVAWGGDVRSSEGFQMSNSLKAPTFPFCAVVTGSSHQRVALLQQIEGPVSPETLITALQKVLDEQGAMLVAARVEEEDRMLSRRLREEQDAAYQAALQADQERERQRQEESERQQREAEQAEQQRREEEAAQEALARQAAELEAALERRRQEKAAAVGAEPEKGPDVTQVLLRLPGGERKERRFPCTATVQLVYDYVDSLGILKTPHYSLVSNFPRTVYGPEKLSQSLTEAGLHPHANLFVQENDS